MALTVVGDAVMANDDRRINSVISKISLADTFNGEYVDAYGQRQRKKQSTIQRLSYEWPHARIHVSLAVSL
jgi:hypothetical protein